MAENPTGQMGFLDHLEELRKTLFWVAGIVAVGTVVTWFFSDQIVDFLLRPAREAEIGREVARLAGGAGALVKRALELAGAGEGRLAGHLVDWAAAAEPESAEVHAARAEIYERRARRARALMTKGVFHAAARESREKAGG